MSASAADGDEAIILYDGQEFKAHEGDTIRYKAYMDVRTIPTATDGYVNAVDAVTYFKQPNEEVNLSIVGKPNCKGVLTRAVVGTDEPGAIYYTDQDEDDEGGFLFDDKSAPLIDVTFKIDHAGSEPITITNKILTLTNLIDGIPVKYIQVGNILDDGQPGPTYRSTLELVDCSHPDEPTVAPTEAPTEAPEPTEAPTVAPTTASDKAIVHISGLDGEVETKEFNVDDDFYVYTTLNASQVNEGKIGSLNARQLYTNSVVKLLDEYTVNDGILDLENVFPITKYATMASGHHTDLTDDDEYHDPTRGAIFYNASIASYRGFPFNDNDDILIKSHYQITDPGEAYITNEVVTLACSDQDLTRIIDRFVVVNPNFRLHSSFYWPESSKPTEGETEAPTEAPEPTEAPTEAPEPTEAPTEAPEPTEAPTEAPVPTEAPTEPAPQTATITIYGFDGQSDTKEFKLGDKFTVYTTLSAADKNGHKSFASVNAKQTFSSDILALTTPMDEDNVFTDNASVFPIMGNSAMGRMSGDGLIQYNGSTPAINNGFKFDSDNDQLIVTTYKVTAGGVGEIRNALVTLASDDEDLTKVVSHGEVTDGSTVAGNATFVKPADDPTEAPTEAPEPTEAPTEAPVPTEAPTEAPEPTEAPTEAPVPTEAPTEPAPEDTYIVAGNNTDIFGTSWNGNDANNTMTKGDDGIYTKQYTVDAA
ncbi:hypothetical protein, partial [uncultured Ruminococcus sp.]|uniref:hypothetical protein n=1 Tax=uncultured Ruminococcus sp. TaxID=165186 RepID=UPI00292FC16A